AKSKEGTLELEDPQELLGSILLGTFLDLGFLEYTNVTTGLSVLLTIGMGFLGGTIVDPLALEAKFTPVEESTGVLESKFVEGVNNFVPRLVRQGQYGLSYSYAILELMVQHQPLVIQGQWGLKIQLQYFSRLEIDFVN
nr:hypothetical protein [Tanacetum cinerariifolium]